MTSRLLPLIFISFFTLQAFAEDLAMNSQLSESQQYFLKAYDAIEAKDRQAIAEYKKKLHHYVLYPYLEYLDMVKNIDVTPTSNILNFVQQNQDTYLGKRLEQHWLKSLGKQKKWSLFLKYFEPQNYTRHQTLNCYYHQALIKTKKQQDKTFRKHMLEQWLDAPTNRACHGLQKSILNKGWASGSKVWQKIGRLMEKGHLKTATRLSKSLSKEERDWLKTWQSFYRNPNKVLKPIPKNITPVIKKQIFTQTVKRLGRRNPNSALKRLKVAANQYGVKKSEQQQLKKWLTTRLQSRAESIDTDFWINLAEAQPEKLDQGLRKAIRLGQWQAYIELYKASESKQKPAWQYWYAFALESIDAKKHKNTSQKIYQELALSRGYYSFLAADRLQKPYQFNAINSRLNMTEQDKTKLLSDYPQLTIIQELIAIDWLKTAQRQWHDLLQKAKAHDFEAISLLAADWNQHHIAIQTMAKIEKWDHLNLRFPTPYQQPVMKAAKQNEIDPTWIYGIIRKESAFSATATSHAGAIGLMQLMPSTARYIGKKIGLPRSVSNELRAPQVNIKLGSAYLAFLLDKFNRNHVLATAAYNAGPNAVKRWLPKENEVMTAEQWIESIPYKETRNYVKTVLEYRIIFQSLMQKDYVKLSEVMYPITALNRKNAPAKKAKS